MSEQPKHTSETDLERCLRGLAAFAQECDGVADKAAETVSATAQGPCGEAEVYQAYANAVFYRAAAETARDLSTTGGPCSAFAAHVVKCVVNRGLYLSDTPRRRGELAAYQKAADLLEPAGR